MGLVGSALEFGMILNTYIKIVFGYLNRFNDIIVGGRSAYAKPRVGQKVSEIVVEFVAVAVTLVNDGRVVALFHLSAVSYAAGIAA